MTTTATPALAEITDAERERFQRDGYLVRESVIDPETCERLRARAAAIVDAFQPGDEVSVFSTHRQAQNSDSYFLDSGDAIRCFYEEEARTPDGALTVPKERAINKIGHALHTRDAVFRSFSEALGIERLARALGQADPLVIQSMYIFKQPRIGGEVRIHQDSSYLYTEPMTCTGFWFALEPATREVGCLWVEPGGHLGPLRERFLRHADDRTELVTLDTTPFSADALVPLEVPIGTMVAFHGTLPHYSAPNRSDRSRHAYTLPPWIDAPPGPGTTGSGCQRSTLARLRVNDGGREARSAHGAPEEIAAASDASVAAVGGGFLAAAWWGDQADGVARVERQRSCRESDHLRPGYRTLGDHR